MVQSKSLFLFHLGLLLYSSLVVHTHTSKVPTKDTRNVTNTSIQPISQTTDDSELVQPEGNVPAKNVDIENVSASDETNDEVDNKKRLTLNGREAGQKRSTQGEKRRLRFEERHQSGQNSNTVHEDINGSGTHRNLKKRQASRLSIANALGALTDSVVEFEQRRLEQEREDLKRRMLAAGKRSTNAGARKNELDSREEEDVVAFLQSALGSSESNFNLRVH